VALRFRPADTTFYDLFTQSAGHLVDGAALLAEMLGEGNDREGIAQRMRDAEHAADETTHAIVRRVNTTFVTPFDREDIRELASELDTIVDLIESVGQLMYLYQIDKSTDDLVRLSDILWQSTETLRKAVAELKNTEKSRRVLDYCIEINRLENAGDQALGAAIGKLFQGKPDPLEVMKWKEIYETIEQAIDKCEDVAHTLETILVKQA